MAGLLDLFGGGGSGDEYGDLLTPAQRNAVQARGLLAMAGAFGDAAMPSRLPVPIGAVLGKAAGALGTGQDEAMNAAIKNALIVQQLKDLRLKMQQRTTELNRPPLTEPLQRLLFGGTAAPGPGGGSPGVPAPGTYVGSGGGGGAGADALSPDLLMGSDYASQLGNPGSPLGGASRFNLGAPDYPVTAAGDLAAGGAVGGRGLLSPGDMSLGLQTPTARYRPGGDQGGNLDPFAYGAPLSDTAGAPKAQAPLAAGGSGGGAPPVDAPEAGGDTAAAAPDTVVSAGGGGLLGVSPDLYRPVEANPLARVNAVLAQIRQRESGGNYGLTPQQNFDYPRSHASGGYQIQPGTWRAWTAQSGFGTEYPEAYLAPPPVQDAVARYAALHGDVNAMSHWGASAGSRPYPDPREGGAVDTVVPSPGGASGNLPPVVRAQYAPGAGAGAPGAGRAVGGAQVPLPAGVDPARFQALMLELADRSAKAEILGLGNPYGPMLQILQNSPQYQAATEFAKRNAVIPLIQEEARQKALGGFETDIATRGFQANLDRATAQIKALGDAALAPAEILVADGKDGTVKVQGTQLQRALLANGFSVPELGIKGLYGPAPPNAIPGLSVPGQSGQATPSPQTQEASPAAPGGVPAAGMPARVPFYTEPQIAQQKGDVEANIKRETDYRAAADAAQKTKTTLQGISADLANVVKGPFSQAAQTIARYGQIVNPGFKLQAQNYENATSAVNELVRQAVRASDPNPTFQQTKMAIDAMPQPNLTEGGIEKIAGRMIGLQNHEIARAEALQQFKDANRGSTSGFDSYWRQNVSPYAFVITRMSEDDQKLLRDHLLKTVQGRAELQTLGNQLQFISRYTH